MGFRLQTAALLALFALPLGCAEELDEGDPSGSESRSDPLVSTTSFQNGVSPTPAYQGTTDTSIAENTPTAPNPGDLSLRADADQPERSGKHVSSLLRFDVSAIPAGSTISAASLTINVTNASSGTKYAFQRALRSWTPSEATWLSAQSGVSWSSAGASGADRGPVVAPIPANAPTGKLTVDLNAAGVAAVQDWVNSPATNHGFVFDSPIDMDGFGADSSEAPTAANRPRLSVSYSAPSTGTNGLLGQYYTGTNFGSLVLSRTDPSVNFDWASGAPASGVPVNGFSVRWTGQVLPAYSQAYKFYTLSDDGVRLWVDGKLLVDNWTNHGPTENSGTLTLVAGKKYDIKLEYYENTGGAVAKLYWSSPSQTKEIIPPSQLFPTQTTPAPQPQPVPDGPLAGLDPTGNTIPDTNYPIPAGAIFMAANGNDANAGTQALPVKTLNRAITLVPTNGTIVVRGGVYRDWYNNGAGFHKISSKPFTLQAYPHEQPWFDGTDVIPTSSWTSDGAGHWYMSWSTPSFCDGKYYDYKYDAQPTSNTGPCSHYDMSRDPSNPAAGDPQMVFIDGAYVHEVKTLAQATAGNFFYDWSQRRIYIATNPSGRTVELAARPVALIAGGSGSYKFRGIGFRRYATNEYNNITNGALYVGAINTIIEDCAFTRMAAGALYLEPRGGILRRTVFANNGFTAVGGNGHSHTDGQVDGLLIERNVVIENNAERFGTDCSVSCAQGGIKNAHLNKFTVKNNLFANNHGGSGYWCDYECTGGVIVNNVAYGNDIGIFLEVGNDSIIASNLAYGNDESGMRVLSANTKIYNNTLVDNGTHDIWIYDDSRVATPVSPNPVNVAMENNVISAKRAVMNVYASNSQTGPNSYFSALDYNSYFRANGCSKRVFAWEDTTRIDYTSLAVLTADRGWEKNGQDICTGSDPFFVDMANDDYTVRSSSVAYKSGKPLPADVAVALGVAAGSVHSRGAIAWPTKK